MNKKIRIYNFINLKLFILSNQHFEISARQKLCLYDVRQSTSLKLNSRFVLSGITYVIPVRHVGQVIFLSSFFCCFSHLVISARQK